VKIRYPQLVDTRALLNIETKGGTPATEAFLWLRSY